MKYIFQASFLFVALFFSSSVLAVGLGDAHLLSSLGQPLNAEIPIIDAGDLTPDDIQVKQLRQLANDSIESNARYRFEPQYNAKGQLVVMATTENNVAEPYVAFTLSLQLSQGEVSRQYTLMLDF